MVRTYGHPLGDLDHVEVPHADLALLLADAEGRIGTGWGAALLDGQLLHLSSQPGGTAAPQVIASAEAFVAVLTDLEIDRTPATVALALDFDLGAPAPADANYSGRPDGGVAATLSPSLDGLNIVAVVGPGVSRAGGEALAEFAARGGVGVFNTFGAKGVFRWDSPFHFGTIGLQAGDVEAAGLLDVDLIVTSGLDPDEFGTDALALGRAMVLDIAPWQLEIALVDWPRRHRTVPERPPLYSTISGIVQPMYERSAGPITPPRAALHLAGAAPDGAVVVADAGMAGYWIARTFPTGIANSVVIPALDQPGFAAAAALVAGLNKRPCVAVIDGPPDESTMVVLEAAATLDVSVAIQSWVAGNTTVDEHLEVSRRGFALDGPQLDVVGVDDGCLDPLLDALGPITAWKSA
ncbi:MAG: hypothetical protein GX868_08515 [Actinobacteria bacterium]|nr:hypothetical protein [Actinomycetota bacterium]